MNGQRVKRELMPMLVEDFMIGMPQTDYIITGSYRRGKADSGDVELVFIPKNEHECSILKAGIVKRFGLCATTLTPKMQGLWGNVQFDLFVSYPTWLGAMLLHTTGSGQFNIEMRSRARVLGYTLNQYGLYRGDVPVLIADNEEIFFKHLGLTYKKPEER